jgi:hemolysin III
MKLICPSRLEQVSIVAYLALGWIILVGMRPLLSSVDLQTAVLVGAGLSLAGAPFHHVIWHGFVPVAASCHYAAILHGVVLALS